MSKPVVRRALSAATISTLSVALMASMAPAADATSAYVYGGSAYGSTATVGPLSSGATSYVARCDISSKTVAANNTAKLELPAVGTVGAVATKLYSKKRGSTKTSVATTKTAATNLLGGLIKASAITTEATSTHSSKGYSTKGSSTFVGLEVNGKSITAKPAKNSSITIPGVATVTLNAQSASSSGGSHVSNVTALRVTLLKGNPLQLAAGTVVVGRASATLHSRVHHRVYGTAYGTRVDLAGVAGSGATAAAGIGLACGGTSGATVTNSVATVSAPGILSAGVVKSSGKSTDTSHKTRATTTSSITGVNVLSGVITVDAVNATAAASRHGKSLHTSSAGTKITGLKILGLPTTVTSTENSSIKVAGVGTLYVRKAVRTSTGVQVYALQLVLNTQVGGLTSGTVINIGSAQAGVYYR